MDANTYLRQVLSTQTLADDSDEIRALQRHRADVEELLLEHFGDCSPTIRYAGSKAKGTMIREYYDLDIVCYFPRDDIGAGETLKDIYDNVCRALQSKYLVEPKTSALRLKNASQECRGTDFHIDVVPGRFTDDSKSDVFLHQASVDKARLKTNIDTHVSHVRDSGVRDAVRLIKLWKVRNGIALKTFVLELLVIKLLRFHTQSALATQLGHVWTEMRDCADELTVEDPANPQGNDLTPALDAARSTMRTLAHGTLALIDRTGWEAVFGNTETTSEGQRVEALRRVAAAVAVPSRPWCPTHR